MFSSFLNIYHVYHDLCFRVFQISIMFVVCMIYLTKFRFCMLLARKLCHLSKTHSPTHPLTRIPKQTCIHPNTCIPTPTDHHTNLINTPTDPPHIPLSPSTCPHTHIQNAYLEYERFLFCFVFFVCMFFFFFFQNLPSVQFCLFLNMNIGTKLDWVSFLKINRFSRYPFCFIIRLYYLKKNKQTKQNKKKKTFPWIAMKTKAWLSQNGLKWTEWVLETHPIWFGLSVF